MGNLFKLMLAVTIIGVLGFAAATAIGVWRYGSLSGLTRRIQLEVRSYLPEEPRPEAAPTLMPRATVDVDAFVAALATPTLRPTYTPTVPPTYTPQVDATSTPQSIRSATPEPTSTPTLLPTATPTPIYAAAASSAYLDSFTHYWQDWNNCGPATLATYLSTMGSTVDQYDIADFLKPNADDKNVNPAEIAAYATAQGYGSKVLINGTDERLKIFVSNGIPVMLESWIEPDPNDGFGHYRLIVGYDDAAQEWIVSDSYISKDVELPYTGIRISYEELAWQWEVFAHTYIIVHSPEQQELVNAILGQDADPELMWQDALFRYQQDVQQAPENGFAWHNLGTMLVQQGEMEQAAVAFDQARTLNLPWRMFWYQFGVYEAYYALGRYEEVVAIANATNNSGGGGEEVYYWKGMGLDALGDSDGASQAWRYALWWRPEYEPAVEKLGW